MAAAGGKEADVVAESMVPAKGSGILGDPVDLTGRISIYTGDSDEEGSCDTSAGTPKVVRDEGDAAIALEETTVSDHGDGLAQPETLSDVVTLAMFAMLFAV